MQKSAITFHLSGVELDKWRLITRGAVAMVSLMRRSSGFWPYPPIRKEIDQYFRGSTELAFSDAEDGSFTVTYAALLALHEVSHQCPPRYLGEIENTFRKMSRRDGSWGNLVYGWTKGGSVFDSARHTAFTLLTLDTFFRNSEIGDSKSSIRWLLKRQLPATHGWKYRELDKEDQAYSTAACIAALARHAVHNNLSAVDATGSVRPENAERQLARTIGKAVDKGLDRLFAMQSDCGLWRGRLDEPNDLSGSADIIDLLSLPEVTSVASANGTNLSLKVAAARKSLIAAQRQRGWPSSPEQLEPSLAATIHVLFTVFDRMAHALDESDHQNLQSITAYIADEMLNNEGGQRLDSWDWIMLARLCALILAKTEGNTIPEHEISEIFVTTESLKNSNSESKKIAILSSCRFFGPCEKNAVFVLSRGSPQGWNPVIVASRAEILNPATDYTSLPESETLEVKGSFSLDINRLLMTDKAEKNEVLTKEVLGTIVALLNSNGGNLVIGVVEEKKFKGIAGEKLRQRFPAHGDDYRLIGIESEFCFSNDQSWDGYVRRLTDSISTRIGPSSGPYLSYARVSIEEGRSLCVVRVLPLPGQDLACLDNEFYYVRVGPSTQLLKGHELMTFVRRRPAQ